jgi:sterol desaturase/sphingolipid hydroxylase (fatty acid hydroxylase superfamily)
MYSTREAIFLLFSMPFYSVLIGTEILINNWQNKGYYSLKSTLENFFFSLSNASLDLFLRGLFYVSVLLWCFNHQFFHIENRLVYWFLLFILEDFAFYIEHRIDHFSRFFWAVHATHHSSEDFNLTTGFRSSVFQPVYRFIYFVPIALMGFQPLDILFMYSLTQTYGILVHTQYISKMPRWFEAIFVSPSHHRVHHASNIIYLDKNMGMCLIIWDKMFGTFQEELDEEPVKFGLTKPLPPTNNPIKLVMHEWIAIGKDLKKKTTLINKIKYLFNAPGWSHDGSTKTSVELRESLNSQTGNTRNNI